MIVSIEIVIQDIKGKIKLQICLRFEDPVCDGQKASSKGLGVMTF